MWIQLTTLVAILNVDLSKVAEAMGYYQCESQDLHIHESSPLDLPVKGSLDEMNGGEGAVRNQTSVVSIFSLGDKRTEGGTAKRETTYGHTKRLRQLLNHRWSDQGLQGRTSNYAT